MNQKNVFKITLAVFAILMVFLPFVISFNSLTTKIVEKNRLYILIQERVVPSEIKMVGLLVRPLGIDFVGTPQGAFINGKYAKFTWNCVGWQSLLLFLISLVFGLKSGNYTLGSKIEAVIIGVLGIFLVNLFRITFTVILLAFSKPIFKLFFHDYFAAILTIIFLFGFWWFAYVFVLVEKAEAESEAIL